MKKSVVREWTESLIIALVLALFIRTFIIQAFKIPSGSMQPTLRQGDRILVNKFIYGAKVPFLEFRLPSLRSPQRSDVIVFLYPGDKKKDFIKRLVGLPGENIAIKNGNIYIDGKLNSDALLEKFFYYNRGNFGEEAKSVTMPLDSFYVLGDNSATSRDSRYWGFVPRKNLIGKAFLIYWPPSRIRIIK